MQDSITAASPSNTPNATRQFPPSLNETILSPTICGPFMPEPFVNGQSLVASPSLHCPVATVSPKFSHRLVETSTWCPVPFVAMQGTEGAELPSKQIVELVSGCTWGVAADADAGTARASMAAAVVRVAVIRFTSFPP
jgi:hypothetical protein